MKKIVIALLFIILISSLSNSNATDNNDEHWNRKIEMYYHNINHNIKKLIMIISSIEIKDKLNFMSTFKEEYELKKNIEFHRDRINKIEELRSISLTGEELKVLGKKSSQSQAEVKLGEMTMNKIHKKSGRMTKSVVSPLMDTWIDVYDVTDKGDITSRIKVVTLILTIVFILALILIIAFI